MYGKIFDSMYDGTLAGHWEAIVTFQQMIVLANADGVVDMTPEAIARRTTIPLKYIVKGIAFLEKPDPYSRTPGEEGARIVRLDEHRDWGWRIVNHGKYSRLRDMEAKREADRVRIAEKRKQIKDVATVSQMSQSVADVAHADAYADKEKHTPTYSVGFDRFWAAWPKHDRKQAAGKCFAVWKRSRCEAVLERILAHVEALKVSDGWRNGYVPAPLVYLNQRRWEGADASAEAPALKLAI